MPPKKSFIVRLFTLLFVVLLAVLTLVGAGIYHYAGQVVGDEFIRLNQASLLQLASATGGKLSDFRAFAEQLSVSSSLIELVSHPDADRDKQARSILNDQFNRFIAAHNNGAALMEIYLVGDNGLHVSLYTSEGFTLADLRADPRCAPLFSGAADSLLLPTAYNETGRGVMVYSFQMIYTMRDLLT
ncbi:MAG: sensor histidine kinase, partial [Pseudoflavonifractor sp.]